MKKETGSYIWNSSYICISYFSLIKLGCLSNKAIINNREKMGTENELKNRELMTKQLEVLNEYEELLFCRLVLELTTN